MAVTVSARSRFHGPSTPVLIRAAGLCAALGVGLSITDYADFGKWITVAGVLLLIYSLHRYGRSGPDAPIVFELAPPRKRKKKKRKAAPEPEAPSDAKSAPAESASAEGAKPSADSDNDEAP
jgi:threonine/homoserine/homoserine lactone efflux protein